MSLTDTWSFWCLAYIMAWTGISEIPTEKKAISFSYPQVPLPLCGALWLLDGNAKLVHTLLDVQQNSSIDGMERTKAQVSHDVGALSRPTRFRLAEGGGFGNTRKKEIILNQKNSNKWYCGNFCLLLKVLEKSQNSRFWSFMF